MGLSRPNDLIGGLGVRVAAVKVLAAVFGDRLTVEEALERETSSVAFEARDRGFLLNIVLTSLRRKGQIDAVLAKYLSKPLPRKSGRAALILMIGVAQLLFLDTPAHAAIDLAVRSARLDRDASHFSGLINAVLRKVAAGGRSGLDGLDAPKLNTPAWLWRRWLRQYGEETARQIAASHVEQPPLDVAVKDRSAEWADRLGGKALTTGHVRLGAGLGPVAELQGFSDGAWWVQDAAAGLPVVLLGDMQGKTALDICAAPGGKTMQLAAAGAQVTAVDSSAARMKRLEENLTRTGLRAEVGIADAAMLDGVGTYDVVLLDAPCSATGTLRRHPELPYVKQELQISELAAQQRVMLSTAADHVRPGGRLVYCTCSLECEEGEDQIRWFRSWRSDFETMPIDAAAYGLPRDCVAAEGWLRTLPYFTIGSETGLDGFFVAILRRAD